MSVGGHDAEHHDVDTGDHVGGRRDRHHDLAGVTRRRRLLEDHLPAVLVDEHDVTEARFDGLVEVQHDLHRRTLEDRRRPRAGVLQPGMGVGAPRRPHAHHQQEQHTGASQHRGGGPERPAHAKRTGSSLSLIHI